MPVLEHLEPQSVFRFFEQLSSIPRGSRHTKAVSDWCVEFARTRGLEWRQDAANNVILTAPPSPGHERSEPLILQGHLDMVCEKAPGCSLDMDREGPQLELDGDFIRARGTTLGGDDGIAVAMAMAVLDNPALPHPPLEVVFTTDEEIGMLGAAALDVSPLRGRRLINIDSEVEGVFTVSCAGGCVASCSLPLRWTETTDSALRIRISGLTGGHSGTEIHRGRANANTLLGRFLAGLSRTTEFRLVRASGGLKDNAIPVAAEAELTAPDPDTVRQAVSGAERAFRAEFRETDPGLSVEVSDAMALFAMDAASTQRAVRLLSDAPNGVQSMSGDIPGLVQTSLNLGILTTEPPFLSATFCVRSSLESEKTALVRRLRSLSDSLGGKLAIEGDYPPWEFRRESALRKLCESVFREQYGHAPKIEAIHAGLECGILRGKLPGLDCISIGPDLLEIHTPRERMSIASVRRVWRFLLEVLQRA